MISFAEKTEPVDDTIEEIDASKVIQKNRFSNFLKFHFENKKEFILDNYLNKFIEAGRWQLQFLYGKRWGNWR